MKTRIEDKAMIKTILIVGQLPPPYYGMSIVTETILKSYLRDRFNIVHLDTSDRRSLSNVGKLDFINIYLAFKCFVKFIMLMAKSKPDIVYVPIAQGTLGIIRDSLFIMPSIIFRKRTILHLHGAYFREYYENTNAFMRFIIAFMMKRICNVIVLGEKAKEIFDGLVVPDKISVIPNGIKNIVDHDKFVQYSKLRTEKEIKTILYLGSLIKDKGFMDVLLAAPLVASRKPNVRFVFAGDFRNQKDAFEAEEFIKSNEISKLVSFVGTVKGEEKANLLLSSYIMVFPSKNEGQPLVILEGISVGLPIITTGVGLIPETISDEENGYILNKVTPHNIAEKIVLLLEDAEKHKLISMNNRNKYIEKYTDNRFIKDLHYLFNMILEANNTSTCK